MKFLSLFSGIEAASVALLPLGWECVGVAEIEAAPCKDNGRDATVNLSPTLRSMWHSGSHQNGGGQIAIVWHWMVRRLIPTECEALQGFKKNYTLVPDGKKMLADGPRYKALGNSMCVNVMRYIGERIQGVMA